jgi:hypothetical protein
LTREAVLLALWRWSWWVVAPAFAVLELFLVRQRLQGQFYEVFAQFPGAPRISVVAGAVFLAAHVWIGIPAVLMLRNVARGNTDAVVGSSWLLTRPDRVRIAALGVALAIEYVPNFVWRLVR